MFVNNVMCQCHLDQQGATDLVIDLVMSNYSSRIFQEAIELAIALLDGGNSVIQVRTVIALCDGNVFSHNLCACVFRL